MRNSNISRDEFKRLLDELASGETSLFDVQRLLRVGPERSVLIDRDHICIHLVESNARFIWNVRDPRTASASLAAIGTYETNETEVLSAFARHSQVVLDVGANVGYYAVRLALAMQPTATLYCFEPIPESAEILRKNVLINGLDNRVNVFEVALSNASGSAELFIPLRSGSSATSMRVLHADEENRSVSVAVRSLDEVLRETDIKKVDLLKIDVEGAEKQVIEGGWDSVRKFRPVVFAELLRKWSAGFDYHPDEVVRMFANIDYECWAVDRVRGLRNIDQIDETTEETNFLFLPMNHASRREHMAILKMLMDK